MLVLPRLYALSAAVCSLLLCFPSLKRPSLSPMREPNCIIQGGNMSGFIANEDRHTVFTRIREMREAFTMETVLTDGTSLEAQANVYENAGTREGVEGSETMYCVFARRYSEFNNGPAGSVDIAQVDHVTICGVDIPVDPAASIPVEQFAEAPVSQPAIPDSPEPPKGKDPVLGTVTAGKGLNVRSGPGTRYQVMGVLKKGEQVTILGEEDGFYQIHCADGQIGYVSKKYVEVK